MSEREGKRKPQLDRQREVAEGPQVSKFVSQLGN